MRNAIATMLVWVVAAISVGAQSGTGGSGDAAREFVRLLDSRHLQSVAAQDPEKPGRFIAALYIPPSQLLVVGATHPAGDAIAAKIRGQQFMDVYLDLQATPAGDGKWFVHDIGADGVFRSGKTSTDNVYQAGALLTLAGSRKADDNLARTDAEYARMLRILRGTLTPVQHDDAGATQITAR